MLYWAPQPTSVLRKDDDPPMSLTPTIRRITLAVSALPLALGLVACGGSEDGGGTSDRPSADDIASSLDSGPAADLMQIPKLPQEALDCIAGVIHDSDLSDKTITALVEGDKEYEDADEEAKLEDLSGTLKSECEDTIPKSIKNGS